MYVGIDVSKGKSQVCILDSNGKVYRVFQVNHTQADLKKLERYLTRDMKIAMETTGNYSTALFEYLKVNYDVNYVDNIRMNKFAQLHSFKVKNDKVDAKLIAKYVMYDYKNVAPIRVDELKDLSRLYQKVLKQLVRTKFMYKDQMTVIFPELEKHYHLKRNFGIANLLLKYPSPEMILEASDEDVRSALNGKLSYEKYTEWDVKNLKNIARESIGVKGHPTTCLRFTIQTMLFQQKLFDEVVEKMKSGLKKSLYYSLVNEFGYKDISLALIVGEVGDITRFPSHKKFVSYCGFDVSEKQSGKSQGKGFITKNGNSTLRYIFYQLVLVHLRYDKNGKITTFYKRLKEAGKHSKKCMTAAARKVAIKCYFDMMRCHGPEKAL